MPQAHKVLIHPTLTVGLTVSWHHRDFLCLAVTLPVSGQIHSLLGYYLARLWNTARMPMGQLWDFTLTTPSDHLFLRCSSSQHSEHKMCPG